MTLTLAPVAPLVCPRGHGQRTVKATTFVGLIWVYCDKCSAVIDLRTCGKTGEPKPVLNDLPE